MRNRKKTQNDAPFVAFYDMRAVTFALPDEMADVSIAGLPLFILKLQLNHMQSHRPTDSHFKPYLHQEKSISFGTRIINLLLSYKLPVVCLSF